jgi:polysaccharide pyruvyl transferase WcaK-like protein
MLCTVRQELSKRIPNAEFFVLSKTGDEHQAAISYGFRSVLFQRGHYFQKAKSILRSAIRDPGLLPLATLPGDLIGTFQNASAVLDISGFAYGDSRGHKRSRPTWTIVNYCSRYGKPHIFLPQAWGPFTESRLIRYVTDMCTRASAVYARDQQSLRYLETLLAGSGTNIHIGPDIAFRFEGDIEGGA